MLVVKKSTAAPIGAEVLCVDLAEDMDDYTFSQIERAFHDNTVIYFRAQRITPQQHARFARRFGELEIHVMKQYHHPEQRELIILSNVVENDRHIGFVDA